MDIEILKSLDPEYIGQRGKISPEEILSWFNICEASWLHSGNPRDPHAELTSGNCSNGFFDCLRVLKYVNLNEILANQLVLRIIEEIGNQKVDWVIASPMAGITFGYAVAKELGANHMFFTEKDSLHKGKMLWNRIQIPPGETVLQIEELITTAKTLNAVKKAVDEGNKTPVNWLPVIGSLVHRPEKLCDSYGDRKVIAIIKKEVWNKPQSECHLCQAGSSRYRPKVDNNWEILTKKLN